MPTTAVYTLFSIYTENTQKYTTYVDTENISITLNKLKSSDKTGQSCQPPRTDQRNKNWETFNKGI